MLQTTIFKIIINTENKKEGGENKSNNELAGNEDKNPYKSAEARKNIFLRRKFFTSKARLACT